MNGEEDMRGQRHSGEGHFESWGKEASFEIRDCIFWEYFSSLDFGWIVIGVHRLLGFLGSRARNPHGILELGSRIGSVPS
jgi:hypothetical protein